MIPYVSRVINIQLLISGFGSVVCLLYLHIVPNRYYPIGTSLPKLDSTLRGFFVGCGLSRIILNKTILCFYGLFLLNLGVPIPMGNTELSYHSLAS